MTQKQSLKIDLYSLDSITGAFESWCEFDDIYYIAEQILAVKRGMAD